MPSELPPPIPAATLILFRDRPGDWPELLFVERAKAMRFAGGALVFPGGRVDPEDHAHASAMTGEVPDDWETAARIAAIRETIEEVGLGVGLDGDPGAISVIRDALHNGQSMAAQLARHGMALSLETLVPFARWCPNFKHARVFDTRFYLARAPEDWSTARADGTENVTAFWATAKEVLDRVSRDEVRLIFPTRRTVERLALYRSFDEAVADAYAHPVRKITPWVEARDGAEYLHIPDDLGFPVTSSLLSEAFRT